VIARAACSMRRPRAAAQTSSATGFRSDCEYRQQSGGRKDQRYVILNHGCNYVARPPSQVQKTRLAANRHNSTDPDVTTVTVMFTKLPKAVENIGVERRAARTDLALGTRVFPDRFFAAMMPRYGGQAVKA
jgi:hypothetical protein